MELRSRHDRGATPRGGRGLMSMPQEFLVDRVPSPLGTILLVCDGAGRLRALDFDTHEARLQRLLRLHYGEGPYTIPSAPAPRVRAALDAFFAGELAALDALAVPPGG